jgi:predicted short-subunit dehydrogenase-like oxidoreductase (DUF2520 family)
VSARPGSTPFRLGVIGPGRAGTGLALAWTGAGHTVHLHGRRAKSLPSPLTLTIGPEGAPPPWMDAVDVIVLAVSDDAIGAAAAALAARKAVEARHIVLHLSGSLSHRALTALAPSGAALGSLHPLQTLVEPARTPDHLQGAWAAVEGMERAMATAERLARDVGLRPFRISPEDKPRYHAAAVFASNYFVVVEAVAEGLLQQTGLPEDAWRALLPLVTGTFENLRRDGPRAALTGPVARGDADTVTRHLAALAGTDSDLYRRLAAVALELARTRGLDQRRFESVAKALAIDPRRERPGVD